MLCSEQLTTAGTAPTHRHSCTTVPPGSTGCPGSWATVSHRRWLLPCMQEVLEKFIAFLQILQTFRRLNCLLFERFHFCFWLEPNSYEKKAGFRVDGYQLGEDFVHLKKIMGESKFFQNSGLYGPDVGQPRDHRIDILDG